MAASYGFWKTLMIPGLLLVCVILISSSNYNLFPLHNTLISKTHTHVSNHSDPPTDLTHIVFGLLGSERAWHNRKAYIQSWWRPNATRGLLYLDKPPTGDLLPWSAASPPYRLSENLTAFLQETRAAAPVMIRMVHGIMELFREMDDHENLRWVVMGDDDSVFFVENIVDVLAGYDHRKYYFIGGQSEFVMSNYWFSFDQGFGGAGLVLSYPLAKALAADMENCLRRYARERSADLITMRCVADIGSNLTPHKGLHQIDLRGDISGLLSSHPMAPLMSLHHLDKVDPIFPGGLDRFQSTRHLMKAASADQSRMLQQTICYDRRRSWTFSVSWGYSVHVYETIMSRSHLQKPIETFDPWSATPRPRPLYMFNTRRRSNNSCESPHVFFFQNVESDHTPSRKGILTNYARAAARGLPPCRAYPADSVLEILVVSPATKRREMDRSECCDVVDVDGGVAKLHITECKVNQIIA